MAKGAVNARRLLWLIPPLVTLLLAGRGLAALPLLLGDEAWVASSVACQFPLNPISVVLLMPVLLFVAASSVVGLVGAVRRREPGRFLLPLGSALLTVAVLALSVAGGRAAKALLVQRSVAALEGVQHGMSPTEVDQLVTHTNRRMAGGSGSLACAFEKRETGRYERRYYYTDAPTTYAIQATFADERLTRFEHTEARSQEVGPDTVRVLGTLETP